jgi:preprotein translocase subunit SecE
MAVEEIKVQDAGTSDKVKLVVAALLVGAGVAGYYLLDSQLDWWWRWAPVAGGIVTGTLVVAWSRFGAELFGFIRDARVELRKIVWPNRNETMMTTVVVLVFVAVAGVFFWLLDFVLAWATQAITRTGG